MTLLVVEAGGTTLRAAVYEPGGRRLVRRRTRPTPNHRTHGGSDVQARVVEAVAALSEDVLEGTRPGTVALAYPGPLSDDGVVLATPTVLGRTSRPFDLAAAAAGLWPGADVRLMNDLTAVGHHLVSEGLTDFAVVTVGSGVGHKVFAGGRPLVGPGGRGGEIGHLRLDFSADAPVCDCGGTGHLGGLASGRGTVALARRAAVRDPAGYRASALALRTPDPAALDGPDLVAAFRGGDPFTSSVVDEAVRALGQGLAAVHLDTGVETIVLVGGFARAMGEPWRRRVVAAACAASWDVGQDWDRVVRLGAAHDDAALLGAGWHAASTRGRPCG